MSFLLNNYKSVYNDLQKYKEELDNAFQEIENIETEKQIAISNLQTILDDERKDIEKSIETIDAFLNIATTHCVTKIEPNAPHPYDADILSKLSVQINSASFDDIYAVQLYTEAKAQGMYLSSLMQEWCEKSQNQQNTIERNFEKLKNDIEIKINSIYDNVLKYIDSNEYVDFINLLKTVGSCFTAVDGKTSLLESISGDISLGNISVDFPHFKKIADIISSKSNKFINEDMSTISIPMCISIEEGLVVISEYDNSNERDVLNGIQNFILNIANYYSDKFSKIVYIDPVRFNSSSLGVLSTLCGPSCFIDEVPTSIEEVRKRMDSIIKETNAKESQGDYLASSKSDRIVFCFHDFPHAYDSKMISQIQQLSVNAKYYGYIVILTQNISSRIYESSNVYGTFKNDAFIIQKANDGYEVMCDGICIGKNFEWYKPANDLPTNIIQKYVENKPIVDMNNDYSSRIGFELQEYKKGMRRISNIPFAIDSNGEIQYLDFEDSNFATFICGASRSGKSTMLHTIITGMLKNNHPDDIEIWLIDFKKTEFSKYIKQTPLHVRYIVLDETPELVCDIIDRLLEILIKRANIFSGKWDKACDVPVERYMPSIMVIIDEFTVMSQILMDTLENGSNYKEKFQRLIVQGGGLGLHFIMSSQGFTDATRVIDSSTSKNSIQQRIAMKTKPSEVKATLELGEVSEKDTQMMENLEPYYALTKIPRDAIGNHLKMSKVLHVPDYSKQHIADYSKQEDMIDLISKSITAAPKYDKDNVNVYINKETLIVDGKSYSSFDDKLEYFKKYLSTNAEEYTDCEETPVLLGEPRRLKMVEPLIFLKEFGENALIISPQNEKMATTSIIMSMILSLEMLNKSIKFLTTKKNPIYKQIKYGCQKQADFIEEMPDICCEIKKYKKLIQDKTINEEYIFILGCENLLSDMSFMDQFSKKENFEDKPKLMFEKRKEGELDILSQMNLNVEPNTENHDDKTFEENMNMNEDGLVDDAYDAREDLKFILMNGPRFGYHFVLAFNTVGDFKKERIDISLFKHKILFATSRADASFLVNSQNAKVIEKLEGHSFRYTNGINSLSYKPFLHKGISWDGWKIVDDVVVNECNEEETYLL